MILFRPFLPLVALAVAVSPAFPQQSAYPQTSPQDHPPISPSVQTARAYPHFPDSASPQETTPQNATPQDTSPQYAPPQYGPPQNGDQAKAGEPNAGQANEGDWNRPRYAPPVPSTLTIPAGKYLTVRSNNFLTTDRNHAGDFFSATLEEPIVIDGFVVAARGQVVNGRVVDIEKAGRVKGLSSLRVELTELNMVDGQQVPFRSQMIYRQGRSSVGRDVGAVGGTAALGAAIGAAATGDGLYAGVGALAGAAAATIGVLSTRGRPTVLTPETLLTFRVEQPITVSTARSADAFTTVAREDYAQPHRQLRQQAYGDRYNEGGAGNLYGGGGYAPYGPGYYGPSYYARPYWNTGFFFYGRPRYYGRGFYGRGRGRRW